MERYIIYNVHLVLGIQLYSTITVYQEFVTYCILRHVIVLLHVCSDNRNYFLFKECLY